MTAGRGPVMRWSFCMLHNSRPSATCCSHRAHPNADGKLAVRTAERQLKKYQEASQKRENEVYSLAMLNIASLSVLL